ncbi:hypothetical protein I5I61_18880 [Pseudomonas nitroreducens]|uniref:DUF1652 domain-containing protein n=1 Tax=Pseudomonas nitroreducens TaxID=46680 RepID=A0ABS0KN70_PSENT|nr:hypothetical protein [Pseudomonas nitroreducens]MBG6289522.1 hypothetical protein [Pseudomonas nitroreducens]
MLVKATTLGAELCGILGLPSSSVTAIRLVCEAGDIARVEVSMAVKDEDLDELTSIMKCYQLVEKEEDSGNVSATG